MTRYVFIISLLIIFSCKRINVEKDAPKCLKERLQKNLRDGKNYLQGSNGFQYSFYQIDEYEWNGSKYYFWKVEPSQIGCLQGVNETICFRCQGILMNSDCEAVFDETGKEVCKCEISASGDAEALNCNTFFSEAKKIRTIWKRK